VSHSGPLSDHSNFSNPIPPNPNLISDLRSSECAPRLNLISYSLLGERDSAIVLSVEQPL